MQALRSSSTSEPVRSREAASSSSTVPPTRPTMQRGAGYEIPLPLAARAKVWWTGLGKSDGEAVLALFETQPEVREFMKLSRADGTDRFTLGGGAGTWRICMDQGGQIHREWDEFPATVSSLLGFGNPLNDTMERAGEGPEHQRGTHRRK